MEIVGLVEKLGQQYRGTNIERLLGAALHELQEQSDLVVRIGERINLDGYGVALDLLGQWLHFPRPRVRDLSGQYFGFQLEDAPPNPPRPPWGTVPFDTSLESLQARELAGDDLYRYGLAARGAQLYGAVNYDMMDRTATALGGRLCVYAEGDTHKDFRTGVALAADANGAMVWHEDMFYAVSEVHDTPQRWTLLRLDATLDGVFDLELNANVIAERTSLPGAIAGLSSVGDNLYAVTREVENGAQVHRIDTDTFVATPQVQSIYPALPALDNACLLDGSHFVGTSGGRAYTCSFGGTAVIEHEDPIPVPMSSLSFIDGQAWAIKSDTGELYRRDASTRAWSRVSTHVYLTAASGQLPWLAGTEHMLMVARGNRILFRPLKREQGYKRNIAVILYMPEKSHRLMIQDADKQLLPHPAGISLDYDFMHFNNE